MSAIDDQLAELLGKNADLYAAYDQWSAAQVLLLAGTVDDPASFNVDGGKAGALGYYPVVNVSGQTIYVPCLARLRALALGGANAETLDALLATTGAKLAEVDAATVEAAAKAGEAATQAARAQGAADAIGDIGGARDATLVARDAAQQARAQSEAASAAAIQTVAAVPARRVPGVARALTVTDKRRRIVGHLSGDGRLWAMAGAATERLTGRVRIRSQSAGIGIDLHDDGAVTLAGQKRTATADPGILRRMLGKRRRVVETLTGSEYRVHGFGVRSTAAGTDLLAPDGAVVVRMARGAPPTFIGSVTLPDLAFSRAGADVTLRNPSLASGIVLHGTGAVSLTGERRRASSGVIRQTVGARGRVVETLTGTVWRAHGLTVQATAAGTEMRGPGGQLVIRIPRTGAPVFAGVSASAGSVRRGDTWLRSGELLPVLPDMTRIAGWGSSSMWYWGDNFAAMATPLGAVFYAGGRAGERIEHTTARLGSHPARLTFPDNVIPASGSVAVSVEGWTTSNYLMTYAGTIGGVSGTLAQGNPTSGATFTRTAAGAAVPIAPGTPFVPTDGMAQRDAVALLNLGKNNVPISTWPADAIVARTHEAFDWLAPMIRRALVIGHVANTDDAAGGADWTKVQAVNAGLKARYGSTGQYVDIDAFLGRGERLFGRTIWEVAGVTPTAADTAAQAEGRLPPSLSRDVQHMSEAADGAIAWLVRQHFLALAYYQEPL